MIIWYVLFIIYIYYIIIIYFEYYIKLYFINLKAYGSNIIFIFLIIINI